MKPILFISLLLILILACSKSESTQYRNLQRTVETSNSDTLEYIVTESSIASIAEMPQFALYTKIAEEPNTGNMVFSYLAEPNYVGEDFVKFRIPSDGTAQPAQITYIHLTITVK